LQKNETSSKSDCMLKINPNERKQNTNLDNYSLKKPAKQ
jgi:hypothetical protein